MSKTFAQQIQIVFQKLNVTKRTFVSRGLWAIAEQGINPIVQLAIAPFLVQELGKAQFGVWALAMTMISLSQLTSFGAPLATTYFVAAHMSKSAEADAVCIIRGALTIVLLGGALAAILTYVGAPAVYSVVFRSMGSEKDVVPIIAFTGTALLVQELDNVYAGALRGAERYDLCAQSEIVCRVSMGAILVVLVPIFSIKELFVSLVLLTSVKAAIKAVQVACYLKSANVFLPSMTSASLVKVFSFGKWQWTQSLGTVFFTGTDQLIVGSVLGPIQLTRYSLCLQLAQNVHLIPTVGMQILVPRISALAIGMRVAGSNEILRSATRLSLFLGMAVGIPILVLAYPLLYFWMGSEFAIANAWLLRVLVMVHLGLTFNIGAYYTMLGLGRVAQSSRVVLFAGLAQLLAAFACVRFGVIAVASSRIIYALATGTLYFFARIKEER